MVSADVTTGKLCTPNEQSGKGVRGSKGVKGVERGQALHTCRKR